MNNDNPSFPKNKRSVSFIVLQKQNVQVIWKHRCSVIALVVLHVQKHKQNVQHKTQWKPQMGDFCFIHPCCVSRIHISIGNTHLRHFGSSPASDDKS